LWESIEAVLNNLKKHRHWLALVLLLLGVLTVEAQGQVVSGTYIGDGTDDREIAGIGFAPDFIIIKGDSDRRSVTRTSLMAIGESTLLSDNNGMLTNRIQDFTVDGFVIGSDNEVNQTGVEFNWIAFRQVPGQMTLGTYIGTETVSEIDVGFEPVYLIVMSEGDRLPYQRSALMPGFESLPFNNSGLKSNLILNFSTIGFWIGSDDIVNQAGVTHHYVAWADDPANCSVGTYIGDGTDNRNILGLPTSPDFVVTKTVKGEPAAMGPATLDGQDRTMDADNKAYFASGIKLLSPNGFRIGGDKRVNETDADFYFTTFSQSQDLDLQMEMDKASASSGDTLICTVTVANLGPANAQTLEISLPLPADLQFVSASADSGSYDEGTGLWTFANLHYDAATKLQVVAVISDTPSVTEIVMTATSNKSEYPDPNNVNDTATAQTALYSLVDLDLDLTVDDITPFFSQSITFDLKVRNLGPDFGTGITVALPLPAGFSYEGHWGDQGFYDPPSGNWFIGNLAASDSLLLTVDARAWFNIAGGDTVTVASGLSSLDQDDPVSGNNASSLFFGDAGTDLDLQMTVSTAACNEGDPVSLDLDITNTSLGEATNVEVLLTVDEAFEYQGQFADLGTFAPETGIWTIGTIDGGETVHLTLDWLMGAGTNGTTPECLIEIQAFDQTDPDTSNNSDAFSVYVYSADLQLDMTVDQADPNVDDIVSLLVTLVNTGPDPATSVFINDNLPPGLLFQEAVSDDGPYDDLSGQWFVGDLDVGQGAVLVLKAQVEASLAGQMVANTVSVYSMDQGDPAPASDSAFVNLTVQSADVVLKVSADNLSPSVGDTVAIRVVANNAGPDGVDDLIVQVMSTAGLELLSDNAEQGVMDPATGFWNLARIEAADSAALNLEYRVIDLTSGVVQACEAVITAAAQFDTDVTSNTDGVYFGDIGADLELQPVVSVSECNEGDLVSLDLDVFNDSILDATGVSVALAIDSAFFLQNHVADAGSYNPETGIWTLGNISAGATENLNLQWQMAEGTNGTSPGCMITIGEFDEIDPDPEDNTAEFSVYVYSADLQLEKTVDQTNPNVGDVLTLVTTLINVGPDAASGILIDDSLPDGLIFQGAVSNDGPYDDETGLWSVGDLGMGQGAVLVLKAVVDESAVASTLSDTTRVAMADQGDPDGLSDMAAVDLDVQGADVVLSIECDTPTADEGEVVSLHITARNDGPDAVDDLLVQLTASAGFQFVNVQGPTSVFDVETGIWTAGRIEAASTMDLDMNYRILDRTGGSVQTMAVDVLSALQFDPQPENNAVLLEMPVNVPTTGHILISSPTLPARSFRPGGDLADLLHLQLVNWSVVDDTLQTLQFDNTTNGPGTVTQLDNDYTNMVLVERVAPDVNAMLGEAAFSGGSLTFSDLNVVCAPDDTLDLYVVGGAGISARAGDVLGLALPAADALTFSRPVDLTGEWPMTSRDLPIVGVNSEEFTLNEVAEALVPIGSERFLVLDFPVPVNGYLPSGISSVTVSNRGTAQASDIAKVEIWLDGGEGDVSSATLLGEADLHDGVYHLSGLTLDLADGGARMFVTVDLDDNAVGGRTLRMSLDENGVIYDNGAAGPADRDMVNDAEQRLSTTDRIYITSESLSDGTVQPGETQVPLLHFSTINTYDLVKELSGLSLTVDVLGPAGPVAPTALSSLSVYSRTDPDAEAQLLASVGVESATVICNGLDFSIPAGETRHIYVYGDVSLMSAADSDTISLRVDSSPDMVFADATEFVSEFPLTSGRRLVIDGSVAQQYRSWPGNPVTLSADDGPVIAMDLLVPANGDREDRLQSLRLENSGLAGEVDIAEMRLWADNGDGVLDTDSGADLDLGTMLPDGSGWLIEDLDLLVPAEGRRLLACVTISGTPTNAAIIAMELPAGGAEMLSGNSGPIYEPVAADREILLSDSPLLASLHLQETAASVGQVVTVVMSIRNASSETIVDINPSLLSVSDPALVTLGSGPVPASLSLIPDEIGTLTWTYEVVDTGTLSLSGSCSGTGDVGGFEFQTLDVSSEMITLYAHADELAVLAVPNLPFSVNRGQQGLVALTINLSNHGAANTAPIQLDALQFELHSEAGAALPAGDILSWVELKSGAALLAHLDLDDEMATTVNLPLDAILDIEPGAEKQVSLTLGLAADGSATGFSLYIQNDQRIVASDLISGLPVDVVRDSGSFPIETGYTELVYGATSMLAYCQRTPMLTVGKGQHRALLMDIGLENPSVDGLTAGVQVGTIALELRDSTGALLADPQTVMSRISVMTDEMMILDRALEAADGEKFILQFTPPLQLDSGATETLSVLGDVVDDTDSQWYSIRLTSLDLFDIRDVNSGVSVDVSVPPDSTRVSTFKIQDVASSLLLSGSGLSPIRVTRGARNIDLVSVILSNPGSSDQASTRVDTLRLHMHDADGVELDPEALLSNINIRVEDLQYAAKIIGDKALGPLTILLQDFNVEPGQTSELIVNADIDADLDLQSFEFLLDATDLAASDYNLGIPVSVMPLPGMPVSVTTGLTTLLDPASELRVSWQDRLPVTISGLTPAVPVVDLELLNTGDETDGDILLTSLGLCAADLTMRGIRMGSIASEIRLMAGETLVATTGDLVPQDSLAVLTPETPLILTPDLQQSLQVVYVPRPELVSGTVRFGIKGHQIERSQPFGVTYPIAVSSAAGTSFPFWTEVSSLVAADLSASYSNYPNPFAAGREETILTYALKTGAVVSLEIFTPHGEKVADICSNARREQGVHHLDVWDGRNGNGHVVNNGVYLAVLNVRFDDGSSERLLRKVAVVR
jgi:uncharacterized repeat protein (TIGR01451 family)